MASLLDIFKETNGPNRQFVKGREGKEGGKEEGSKAKGLRGEKPCLLLPASLLPSFFHFPSRDRPCLRSPLSCVPS